MSTIAETSERLLRMRSVSETGRMLDDRMKVRDALKHDGDTPSVAKYTPPSR